jgi:hypothetical protein
VAWAVLMLVIGLAAVGAWAWYFPHHLLAATSEAEKQGLLRQVASVSAGIGIAILIMGVIAFLVTGDNWLVLAVIWAFGLLHLARLSATLRRARPSPDRADSPR